MVSVSSLEKRVAVLEAERRVVKEMHPAIREALERVKAGIPDREEHMRRLEVNRGR